ncbi:hypothetical protein FVEG_01570 [Fusarium verticillioides 7600]|nr:hypothetical protein FVEG_01570 [Fusarium verticillioides 7600]EWG38316.1 hypothetical protein FVEG_01570 [Fusarium verticillioides 7600]
MHIINDTMDMIKLIEDEEPFKTRAIRNVLRRIQTTGTALTQHLQEMCVVLEKGGVRNFVHQLRVGTKEVDQLEKLLRDLTDDKQDLGTSLEYVHVGLTHKAGQAVAVNTAAVQELNHLFKAALGDKYGLRIAAIVQNRQANGEGLVFLDEHDITELSGLKEEDPSTSNDDSPRPRRKERYIERNEAIKNSFMLNVPVADEPDTWAHIDIIRISDNKATDGSTMVNYPISSKHLMALIQRPLGN